MGRATVLKLAALGAEVIALDRSQAGLDEVAASSAGTIATVQCDLSDPAEITRAFERVGSLDAAVNAAAIGQLPLPIEQIDLATMDKLIAINFRAVALCIQAELPLIRARGRGAIVNLSSAGGLRGAAGMSVYCAVKHAVMGLTRSVAAEVAAEGIRVNAICPGLTDTPMLQELDSALSASAGVMDRMIEGVPMRGLGQADEVADAIIWLIGDSASYVAGAAISVDGGTTAV
jgi:NAD(P)-dependent dehydrogenase (short-subunit alcohol dehydrogenase family)